MRATRFGPSVALLVSSAIVLTVDGPVSAQGGRGISPVEAKRVVSDYTAANARNNATLDLEGQGAVEEAPIRTIDDANYREYRGRGEGTLNENVQIDKIRVYVPRQSSYPLQLAILAAVVPKQTAKKRVRVLGDYQGIVQASGESAAGATPTSATG